MGMPYVPRSLSDDLTLDYAKKGVRALIVRLPPIVHGPVFVHQFITAQIQGAKKNGVAGYVNDGSPVWASVHVKDAAALYVLALTNGPSAVSLYGIQERGMPTKNIAALIAKKLGIETKGMNKEEAAKTYGPIGNIMAMGRNLTAKHTEEWTGWKPKEYGLLQEMEGYNY